MVDYKHWQKRTKNDDREIDENECHGNENIFQIGHSFEMRISLAKHVKVGVADLSVTALFLQGPQDII